MNELNGIDWTGEWTDEFIKRNKSKRLSEANTHDDVIWRSEIRVIVVYFKSHDSAFGKGNNVKLVPAPDRDKQINHVWI